MKFEFYNEKEVEIKKLKHNKFVLKKYQGKNEWRTNVLTNVLDEKSFSKISAFFKILKFGSKVSGYHIMVGIHPLNKFGIETYGICNDGNGLYIHANDSSKLKNKFTFYFIFPFFFSIFNSLIFRHIEFLW